MSANDPAVEAAKRAWVDRYGVETLPGFNYFEDWAAFVTASAREALKPIREMHQRVEGDWAPYCSTCWGPLGHKVWPCVTARLVYSSEELAS